MKLPERRFLESVQCTEVRFESFLLGGIITAIVVNPPEKKTGKTHLRAGVQQLLGTTLHNGVKTISP